MYTESTAFIQFLQIIGLMACITLELLAFVKDASWKDFVHDKGYKNVCPRLLKTISPIYFEHIFQSKENSTSEESSTPAPDNNHKSKADMDFLQKALPRPNPEEVAAIVLIFSSLVILILHLIVACVSKNYQYRTKWTGAAQGTVIFCCGFAAIFLSIGVHYHDHMYEEISEKFTECEFLWLCKGSKFMKPAIVKEEFLSKFENINFANDTVDLIKKTYLKYNVCQDMDLKIAAAALCGVVIAMSMTTICIALDLTTLYDEEDIDEEEKARRKQLEKTGGIRPSQSSHMSIFKSGSHAPLARGESTGTIGKDKDKGQEPEKAVALPAEGAGKEVASK